jgi:curved DNA-binding protein
VDYYQILGVNKNATEDEIKKAYRKLAMKHHPDRGGDQAEFQKVQEAYATLSDPQKRSQYDNPQPQFHGPGGFHFTQGGMPPGFEDIFSSMMGQGPFGDIFGRRPQQPQRNRTLNIQTSISLEDAFNGKDLIASIKLPSGREQALEIKIPAGIQDGTTLRLAGMGDDSVPQLPKGDIHLTVRVEPHHKFNRQGDDLLLNIRVNCIDAIIGTTVTIDTLDKKTLDVRIAPGTQHGQILAAGGYGMPKMSDNRFKGRLLIQVNIEVPTNLTPEQIEKLKNLYN